MRSEVLLRVRGPSGPELPWVELDAVALGWPLLAGPGEELKRFVEVDGVLADAADEPRSRLVVFGDLEAVRTHVRIFACSGLRSLDARMPDETSDKQARSTAAPALGGSPGSA